MAAKIAKEFIQTRQKALNEGAPIDTVKILEAVPDITQKLYKLIRHYVTGVPTPININYASEPVLITGGLTKEQAKAIIRERRQGI